MSKNINEKVRVLFAAETGDDWVQELHKALSEEPEIALTFIRDVGSLIKLLESGFEADVLLLDPFMQIEKDVEPIKLQPNMGYVIHAAQHNQRKHPNTKLAVISERFTPQGMIDALYEHKANHLFLARAESPSLILKTLRMLVGE